MKIACLSGKGGAGKTLVAVNLAAVAKNATYIDCDVEEPNGRLFLKPVVTETKIVTTLLPEFDPDKCIGCKKCVQFCRFHALIYIKDNPIVFAEICHSCGGCRLVCDSGAITEKPNPVGTIEIGNHADIRVVTGILNPGEASGVPVIKAALDYSCDCTIIDCPPGSACSVMESIMDADYCLLIAEATAFGFHNFRMVYELATLLGKKCGVVINKQEDRYEPLDKFCEENNLPILLRLPYDPYLASLAANGKIAAEEDATYRAVFEELLAGIGGAL